MWKNFGKGIRRPNYLQHNLKEKSILNDENSLSSIGNVHIIQGGNTPFSALTQIGASSRLGVGKQRIYIKVKEIENLAENQYGKNGRGITFTDLLAKGLATNKRHAQNKLKYCHDRNILFTLSNHKPQQYFPQILRSKIIEARNPKNTPIGVTGLPSFNNPYSTSNDPFIMQTLEGYVLSTLPEVALGIHKIQLMVRISTECYQEINLPANRWNGGKEYEEIIGSARTTYRFYANGTVMISVRCNNHPFKVQDEDDLSYLTAFLGQVRDRVVLALEDRHERIVPPLIQWELKQCDINRDVKVEDWLQFTGLNIQVRHALRLFRVYIKSMREDTVCRVEESISPKNKSVVEAINNIFNPTERLEKQILDLK